jgi:transcriptional regulator with XRE-family HTH domain
MRIALFLIMIFYLFPQQSQKDLIKKLGSSVSIISKYERGEVTPSIDAAKRIAEALDISSDYLIGLTDDNSALKDKSMLDRMEHINSLPQDRKDFILQTVDALLRDAKTQIAYK